MNHEERLTQFTREARAFFMGLYGHADLREREALAAFLRGFAERVTQSTLNYISGEDARVMPTFCEEIVDRISPLDADAHADLRSNPRPDRPESSARTQASEEKG